ncbi:MAG: class I SAM-dependent methyltransferase [Candidatus Paceibacterota bacterium]|jgi:ubiquinone/menaquinone biosynthesis C-methylase UbiE
MSKIIVDDEAYANMWDVFAEEKASGYLLGNKYRADNIVGLIGVAREDEIFRALRLEAGESLLDVGCASGHQIFRAVPKCSHAVGIDVGKKFIETAKKYQAEHGIKNAEFLLTDGGKIPFPDNSFGKLICSEVIEHVPNHHSFLRELIRVVKPGGILVFTVPHWNSRGTFWKRLKNGFRPFPFVPLSDFSAKGIAEHKDAHVRQFSIKEFSDFVRGEGLLVEYDGGAAFVDGPYVGAVIARTKKIRRMQSFFVGTEHTIAKIPFLKYFGRHIVLRARKAINK